MLKFIKGKRSKMKNKVPDYCVMKNAKSCDDCPLVNYGRGCMNNKVNERGKDDKKR